ncbi:sensor histidine kinase [Sanguibacter sp. A247]|uniref:sensor histidine kinase n=1 Tax=unclassified Sanguibacter TaxID=2645534 RepID=UPI003FD8F400
MGTSPPRHDERRDRIAHVAATFGTIATFYTITGIYMWAQVAFEVPTVVSTSWTRYGVNLLSSVTVAGVLAVVPAYRAPHVGRALPGILVAALGGSIVRIGLLVATGVFPPDMRFYTLEGVAGLVFGVGGGILGFAYTSVRRSERAEARYAAEAGYQRELALKSLETEEVRVRRSIAEGLHGSLQQRLVIAAVQVDMLIADAHRRGEGDEVTEPLLSLRSDLEDIRENDVRATSRMLYPEGIEIGVVPAVRMLLRRLPTGIATRMHVGEALRRLDDPGNSEVPPADRLLVVRIVEEAVTNGLRHGHATSFVVSMDVEDSTIVIDIANNGGPVDAEKAIQGSGTRRLRERLELAGGMLTVTSDVEEARIRSGEVDGQHVHHAHLRARLPVIRESISGLGHLPSDR